MSTDMNSLTLEQRRHIASWAIKTSRTEEWTGQQVLRLLPIADDADLPEHTEPTHFLGTRASLVQQAGEELNHARLYAGFALSAVDGLGLRTDLGENWCSDYAKKKRNFADAPFTAIFRVMEQIPLTSRIDSISFADRDLVNFMTRLFFLDYAGLLTVGVYQESPFQELQDIALVVHGDEGRHIQNGLAFLRGALKQGPQGRANLWDAARAATAEIACFFGGDESPAQKTLRDVGIRKTSNKDLFAIFKRKVGALLEMDLSREGPAS